MDVGDLLTNGFYVREVANGMLAVLSTSMASVLGAFVWKRYRQVRSIVVLETDDGVRLAVALSTYALGEALRSLYAAVALHCDNFYGRTICLQNGVDEAALLVYPIATFLYLLGGACALRVLVPIWRPFSWVVPLGLSIVLPILYFIATAAGDIW